MIKHGTMKVKIVLLEVGDGKYHRYSRQKYKIQIASFSDEDKANSFKEQLENKNIQVMIKIIKVKFNKIYYRIIIDNLNYYELQIYRVKLNTEGFNNYLIIKK
jgi:hypothetical protein